MGRLAPTLCAIGIAASCLGLAEPAEATETQWRLGADGGYAIAGLPEGTLGGLLGGLHGTYGLTDAFNLRVNADTTWYGQPAPAQFAMMWSSAVGLEYVIDILRWVPTLGALAGPVGIWRKGGEAPSIVIEDRHDTYFALEFPLALGYQVLPELNLGVEGRFRWLVIGSDVGPIASIITLARAEYVWGE